MPYRFENPTCRFLIDALFTGIRKPREPPQY
jgi:hypothetical protein